MFIIIPAIIVFLCAAYLSLNEVSIYTEIFVYLLVITTITVSIYIYKQIQKNLIQQELNSIQREINSLDNKLINTKDEKIKTTLKSKIELLEKEKLSKVKN